MSDTVQAPGPAPIAQPAHVDLGAHPLMLAFLLFVVVGPVGLLLLVAAAVNSQGGAVLALVMFIPWLVIAGMFGIGFLKTLFGSGALSYRRTQAAVREGRIGFSYGARSWLGDNIIVVDEAQRLLCVNGEVIGFDAVRKLERQSSGNADNLVIVLASGANPVRNVDFSSETRLKLAFERLCNSLGFSS